MSDYRLDGWGSIPAQANNFPLASVSNTSSEAHTASCTIGTGCPFPGVNRGLGVTVTTSVQDKNE
jgi:hypothetical protein